jgi:DNA-directed RNA polymerase II subunit RPB1
MHRGRVDVKQQKHVDFPVNIARIVSNALELQRKTVPPGWPSDLDPRAVLDEIEAMVRDLTPHRALPQCMVFSVLLRAHLSPKRLLREGMTRATFDAVASDIRDRFEDSLAQPGDMVGIVSAQSLGEPTTQLTLNTFHLAGVASGSKAVSGLPRVMELLNVTANPKQSLIYVHLPEDLRYSSEAATQMKARLETTMLSQIVSRSRVYYDPDDSLVDEDRDVVEVYRALFPKGAEAAPGSPWVIRLELDRSQMLEHCVTMLDVSDAISRFYRDTVSTMHSDDNSAKLVFRIRMNLGGGGGADDDLLTEVRAFEAAMMESVSLKGSIGIRTAMPMQPPAVKMHEFDGAAGRFVPVSEVNEWILETDGRDLSEVLASPLVDSRNTESNDICETLRVLGVEAARQKLYEELQEVLRDSDINPRHVLLLADTMTLGGGLQSINRHGINRGDIGPLAKCSFEETTDMLTNAAMFADVDRVNGVSASIMLGQVPPGGTGGVHPVLDESLLVDEVFVEHPRATDEDESTRISDREDMCRRIMRFSPIDLSADDGWNSPLFSPKIVVDKK